MIRIAMWVWVLAACGGGGKKESNDPAKSTSSGDALSNTQPAPAQPAKETAMMAMRRFTNEMCACKMSDCAKEVSDRMTRWSQEAARNAEGSIKLTEAEQREATEFGTRMGECMMKAMGQGSSAP